MTWLGDFVKRVTGAAAELGEAVVDGVGDVAESVTGKNPVTRAVREVGIVTVRGTKEVADAAVDVGEAVWDTVVGSEEHESESGERSSTNSGPQRTDEQT